MKWWRIERGVLIPHCVGGGKVKGLHSKQEINGKEKREREREGEKKSKSRLNNFER